MSGVPDSALADPISRTVARHPTPPIKASQQAGSCLGYTCHAANVSGRPVRDPKPSFLPDGRVFHLRPTFQEICGPSASRRKLLPLVSTSAFLRGKSRLKRWDHLASSTRYRFASTAGRHDAPFPTLAQGEHPMIVRILIGVLTMAATLATATAASAHDESIYPDWSGQWRCNAMVGDPRDDPSKPAGAAKQAPLTEEVKRIHEENMAEHAPGRPGR